MDIYTLNRSFISCLFLLLYTFKLITEIIFIIFCSSLHHRQSCFNAHQFDFLFTANDISVISNHLCLLLTYEDTAGLPSSQKIFVGMVEFYRSHFSIYMLWLFELFISFNLIFLEYILRITPQV